MDDIGIVLMLLLMLFVALDTRQISEESIIGTVAKIIAVIYMIFSVEGAVFMAFMALSNAISTISQLIFAAFFCILMSVQIPALIAIFTKKK